MCGICGFIGSDKSAIGPNVRGMMQAIAHRGPDAAGFIERDLGGLAGEQVTAGFGFQRLAILDLSPAGNQPMVNPDTGDCLVFNGEIYNFRDLRRELELLGHRFVGGSDSEVLLHALTAWGDSAVTKLRGMFAFAFLDARTSRIILVRDPYGIKPLYWTVDDGGSFAFASEVKAFTRLPALNRAVDVRTVVSHLAMLSGPGDGTMFQQVKKLPPGHILFVDAGRRPVVRRYSRPQYAAAADVTDAGVAAGECRVLLEESVNCHMVADVTVGGFLSGGIDSSAIAYFAAHHARDGSRYPAFTSGLPEELRQQGDGFVEDEPFARIVAEALGIPLTSVPLDPGVVSDVDRMVWQLDEPIADPAAMIVFQICRAARESGVKVLLSGVGADDIFTGYRRHTALRWERWWSWAPLPARRLLSAVGAGLPAEWPSARRVSRLWRDAAASDRDRLLGYFFWMPMDRIRSLLTPVARELLGDWSPASELRRTLDELRPGTHRLNQMLALDTRHFLADHNLLYTDKMSMAHGVEVRVPFVDREVIGFAERVAPAVKYQGGQGKSVLRAAVKGLIPDAVLKRSKTGFGINLRGLLLTHFRDRDACRHLLDRSPIATLLCMDGVAELAADYRSGRIDAAYTLYAIIAIESWVRQFQGTVNA